MWTGRLSSDRRSVPSIRFARTDACRAGRCRRAEQSLSTARQSRAGHPRLCFFFPPFLPSPSHAQQQQQYGRARRAVEKLNQARSPLDPQLELGHTLTRSQLASAHSALAQSQSFPPSPTPPPPPLPQLFLSRVCSSCPASRPADQINRTYTATTLTMADSDGTFHRHCFTASPEPPPPSPSGPRRATRLVHATTLDIRPLHL